MLTSFWARLHARLVADWRQSWRWSSVRLTWLAGVAVATLVQFPHLLVGLSAYVPAYWRPLAALLLGFLAVAVPWIARITTKKDPANGK